jgi:hypothetical protein
MGKLYANRTLLGNIALVVFIAFLATLTFGAIPNAGAVTPTNDPSLVEQVSPGQPAAVKDKSGAWKYDTQTATLQTNAQKTQVSFTIQVCTEKDFSSILLKIVGIGNLDMNNASNAVYKVYTIGGTVYYVYQFIYTWVYGQTLSVNQPNDYTLQVYSNTTQLASIILDLEAPPPESSSDSGGTPTAPSTTTATDTGTVSVTGGTATLTVADSKVDALLADPKTENVPFEIPSSVASQGTVAVNADTLAKVLQAGKPAVFKTACMELNIEPKDLDLSALVGQGAKLNVNIIKSTAPLPGQAAYRIAGEIINVSIDVIGADGTRKGGIDSFSSPVTLTLPYDPAKLAGVTEDLLGIYRYNETTGQWDLVPGSKVNKADKTVSVERLSLSKYAVMAYTATFTDTVGHWAEADVKLLAARGIVKGMTAATFAPEAKITRAQFTALMLRALGITEQNATGLRFNDVPANAWYAGAVETAAAKGLVSGYPDGAFKPDANITRQELGAMVAKALSFQGKAEALTNQQVNELLKPFADRNEIGAWAEKAAALMAKTGIVQGRTTTQFAPRATATRAEATVMVKRMLSFTGKL